MGELTIEQRHLDVARRSGACDEGLQYEPGTPVSDVEQGYLLWVQENVPALASEAEALTGLPLWALAGYGDGSGSGYVSGYGYGYGSGYGSGSGYGDGSGYGSGDGYGYSEFDAVRPDR